MRGSAVVVIVTIVVLLIVIYKQFCSSKKDGFVTSPRSLRVKFFESRPPKPDMYYGPWTGSTDNFFLNKGSSFVTMLPFVSNAFTGSNALSSDFMSNITTTKAITDNFNKSHSQTIAYYIGFSNLDELIGNPNQDDRIAVLVAFASFVGASGIMIDYEDSGKDKTEVQKTHFIIAEALRNKDLDLHLALVANAQIAYFNIGYDEDFFKDLEEINLESYQMMFYEMDRNPTQTQLANSFNNVFNSITGWKDAMNIDEKKMVWGVPLFAKGWSGVQKGAPNSPGKQIQNPYTNPYNVLLTGINPSAGVNIDWNSKLVNINASFTLENTKIDVIESFAYDEASQVYYDILSEQAVKSRVPVMKALGMKGMFVWQSLNDLPKKNGTTTSPGTYSTQYDIYLFTDPSEGRYMGYILD